MCNTRIWSTCTTEDPCSRSTIDRKTKVTLGVLSLSALLYPLTEPVWIFGRTHSGEGPARVTQVLPQVLKFFLPTVDGENVYNANKVAAVWPVDDMESILAVGQQSPMMLMEVLQLWVATCFCGRAPYLLEGDLLGGAFSCLLWPVWSMKQRNSTRLCFSGVVIEVHRPAVKSKRTTARGVGCNLDIILKIIIFVKYIEIKLVDLEINS